MNFNVELIRAQGSETIEEAAKHLVVARSKIKFLEKVILEMKQETHDLTQDLYNRLKPGEKPYVKTIKYGV